MTKFTVALLQLLPGSTPEETMKKGISACRQAKAAGADIALFPEMWNCGYRIPEDIGQLKAAAVPVDGAFVQTFGALAAELDMAIAITFWNSMNPFRAIPSCCLTGTESGCGLMPRCTPAISVKSAG